MKSIIDKAYTLLKETKITARQISKESGLGIVWVRNFCTRYKKGQDFHVKKTETLIEYLSKESTKNDDD